TAARPQTRRKTRTHGSRRGLYPDAASRLSISRIILVRVQKSSFHAHSFPVVGPINFEPAGALPLTPPCVHLTKRFPSHRNRRELCAPFPPRACPGNEWKPKYVLS